MQNTEVQVTIANFTYEKNPGDKSSRQVVVLQKPFDSYLGVEIKDNDLSPIQNVIDYLADVERAKVELLAKHGLTLKDIPYKRFKQEKIGNIYESNVTVK